MKFRQALKDERYFEEYMNNWFDKEGKLGFGYNDGYYWEEWTVKPNDYGNVLIIYFHIGSGSGYVPTNDHVEIITYEEFRKILLNKKFENDEINLLDIIEFETEKLS